MAEQKTEYGQRAGAVSVPANPVQNGAERMRKHSHATSKGSKGHHK